MWNTNIAPLILILGPRWMWVVNCTLRQIYPWTRTLELYQLEAASVPQSLWTFKERKREISVFVPKFYIVVLLSARSKVIGTEIEPNPFDLDRYWLTKVPQKHVCLLCL